MDKFWLKNYPPGMPAEIDPDIFASLSDMLKRLAVEFADRPACHNLGHTITYAELDRLASDFAAFLQTLPGMTQGELEHQLKDSGAKAIVVVEN